ncbi:MAG: MarR family transcriptional regulator [Chloroflexi bacterium]|nr:MarR family transcriptional regulator [Chloroflexota bacterium]
MVAEEEPAQLDELLVLLEVAHSVRQRLDSRAKELTGLTLAQAAVLSRIAVTGDSPSVSSIAAAASRASHTVTGTLKQLERSRLVVRRQDSQGDRRRVLVSLTPAGADKLRAFRQATAALIKPLGYSARTEQEKARLAEAVRTLAELLSE